MRGTFGSRSRLGADVCGARGSREEGSRAPCSGRVRAGPLFPSPRRSSVAGVWAYWVGACDKAPAVKGRARARNERQRRAAKEGVRLVPTAMSGWAGFSSQRNEDPAQPRRRGPAHGRSNANADAAHTPATDDRRGARERVPREHGHCTGRGTPAPEPRERHKRQRPRTPAPETRERHDLESGWTLARQVII